MKTEEKRDEVFNLSIRIPSEIYETFITYKNRFKPHMSLNAIIVEAIIEQTKQSLPSQEASA